MAVQMEDIRGMLSAAAADAVALGISEETFVTMAQELFRLHQQLKQLNTIVLDMLEEILHKKKGGEGQNG